MSSFFFKTLTPGQAQNLNPLVLAYVGDAVQTLFVRQKLALEHDAKAGSLHSLATRVVNAESQARLAEALFEQFTEVEKEIFLRGRNSKAHHKAKNQSSADYRKASGLEAVFGYLYLIGEEERLLQLLCCEPQRQD